MQSADVFADEQGRLGAAIEMDDPDGIERALLAGGDPNTPGKHGVTPLQFAVSKKKKRAIVYLLGKGSNPNARADDGETAVTLAAQIAYPNISVEHPIDGESNLDILIMLVKAGGDPNTRFPDDDPVLLWLVSQKNLAGIREISRLGADLNILSREKNYAIIEAALAGYWDVVWQMIECGADWSVVSRGFNLANTVLQSPVQEKMPLYPYWRKIMDFLQVKGVALPGAGPRELGFISRGPKHRS